MSHCAPEATLKPIRFEFTPETVVSNISNVQCLAGMELEVKKSKVKKLQHGSASQNAILFYLTQYF